MGVGGSCAGSYLACPTSPNPSHNFNYNANMFTYYLHSICDLVNKIHGVKWLRNLDHKLRVAWVLSLVWQSPKTSFAAAAVIISGFWFITPSLNNLNGLDPLNSFYEDL